MRFEVEVDEELNCLRVRASGKVDAAGVRASTLGVVEHPRWRTGMGVLADYRAVDGVHLRTSEIRELAELMRPFAERLGEGPLALVLGSRVMFGLARMWTAYASIRFAMKVQVFHEVDAAGAWLAEHGRGRDPAQRDGTAA